LRTLLPGEFQLGENGRNSILLSFGSICAVFFAVQSLRRHPPVEIGWYVMLVLGLAFLFALSVVVLFRVPYAIWFLIGCHVALGLAVILILPWTSDVGRLRYVAIPGGAVIHFHAYLPARTRVLESPIVPTGRDEVVVADMDYDHFPQWERFIADCTLQGIPVFHYKQVLEQHTGRVNFERISENNFGSVLPSHSYIAVKYMIDLVASVALLPLILPIIGAAAVAIKMSDRGPVFFVQDRVGYRGNIFRVVKLRTMRVGGTLGSPEPECQTQAAMTQEDDPRITSIGKLLRKYRIDELPQVFNILRGEMSWIGPRPEAVPLSQSYEAAIPFYRYRHAVRPGISGWAQVSQGHVTSVADVQRKLEYDFYYIKNISPIVDLLIVARTIKTMLSGNGAK
jgi:lipopolysaccharide/colanic/teichoic acid biosynthesis glycosyltransferase